MPSQSRKAHTLLITGLPGVGKTTVIRKVADGLRGRKISGFVTDEIREQGRRLGFLLEAFDGHRTTLAHIDIPSPHRVGKYGVDVAALDRVVDAALRPDDAVDVYLVDEIGKMECFSRRFVDAMTALLDSYHTVVATIARRGTGFIQRVKDRPDAELWEVTRESRDEMPERILDWIARREGMASAEPPGLGSAGAWPSGSHL
jgi:nucleoside-triphosphatase